MAKKVRKARSAAVAKAIDLGDDAPVTVSSYGGSEDNRMPANDLYWMLYVKHPWVNAAVRLIANTVCGDGFSVQQGDDDDGQILKPNAAVSLEIREFLKVCWPTGHATNNWRRAQFALCIDLLVYGMSYWGKHRGPNKGVIGLERLDPRLMTPVPTKDRTKIDHFRLKVTLDLGAGVMQGTSYKDLPADDVVFFRRGGGDELLGAPSPLESLDLTMAQDLAIRKFREAFFRNGAKAGSVLINKTADLRQIKAAEAMLWRSKSRAENAFKTWILAGDWDLKQLAKAGENEVDFVKASGLYREEILSVYHVPPGKLLFSDKALGSAGKTEDDNTFQEQCVLPLEEDIYETITSELLQREFELDNVRMVPRRRSKIRLDLFDAAGKLVTFGGTGNEARVLVNLPPFAPDPAKDDQAKIDMDVPMFITTRQPANQEDPGDTPNDQSGNGGKMPKGGKESKEQSGRKARPTFPAHLSAKYGKKAQRLIGRLHEQLSSIILPHVATSKADNKSVPDDAWKAALAAIEDAYRESGQLGLDAGKGYGFNVDEKIRQSVANHVASAYAKAQHYVKGSLIPFTQATATDESMSDEDKLRALSARLEMYASGAWPVFQQSQGTVFEYQQGLLLIWSLDPASQHCDDCPELADGGPYTTATGDNPIPSYPGDGGTECLSNCNCSVEPEEDSWNSLMRNVGEAEQPEIEALTAGMR